MRLRLQPLALLTPPLTLCACMGTDTGNASQGEDLSPITLQLTTAALSAKADGAAERVGPQRVESGDAALTLTGGALSLAQLELQFAPGVTCSSLDADALAALDSEGWSCAGGNIKATGGFAVDLFSGESTPPLPRLPAGDYKLMDLRLAPADAADGVTLSVTGDLSSAGGAAVPFSLSLTRFTEDVRFKRLEPGALLRVEEGAPLSLLLNASVWFEGVDVGACVAAGDVEPNEEGVLALERGAGLCQSVVTTLRRNIRGSGEVR
jgi:hypothetical protein